MFHEKDEPITYRKCKFTVSAREIIDAKVLRQLYICIILKRIIRLSVHRARSCKKNSGALSCELEYTREKLAVSHSYESYLHIGQPRDVSVYHAKVHYNFISRRFRDWQSPDEIVITYFSRSETTVADHIETKG